MKEEGLSVKEEGFSIKERSLRDKSVETPERAPERTTVKPTTEKGL